MRFILGGIANTLHISAALLVSLIVTVVADATKCAPRLIRIQTTSDARQANELKYPGELTAPIYVTEKNALICSVSLNGECPKLAQSNLVLYYGGALSPKTNEHFVYVPLSCAGNTCTGSLFPAHESRLLPAAYSIKLMLAWKDSAGTGDAVNPIDHLQWSLGMVDFSGATLSLKGSDRPGTPDQQEDLFEPTSEGTRSSSPRIVRPRPSLALALIMTTLLTVPLLLVLVMWSRLGIVSLSLHNVLVMSAERRALIVLFVTWCALAMITWLSLDIFALLKISALLVPPTIICLARVLRGDLGGNEPDTKKTQ